ncbi:MAG: diacylglycerol kinase family lipid kinase, partial [Verrucomicrobia bacterium]|nr:diacylglycerol kinase family lipid kinase [Verrucomicrobiota bacterium]
MDKNKVCIIFNPAARGEKAQFLLSRLATLAKEVIIESTQVPGEATKLAINAVKAGFEAVVAAGGDGTINEVVNGIGESGVKLGILPIGTMNVFAYELGLPINEVGRCWEIILQGRLRKIDLALANDQYFVQLAGVGLDAQVLLETDLGQRRMVGPLSYVVSAAHAMSRPAPQLQVTIPGLNTAQASFVLVGNGRNYGGPFCFFPGAKNDDGLLDVLLFKSQGYFEMFRYLQQMLLGNHSTNSDLEYLQCTSLTI